jgi:hypothetical protein
MQVARYTVELRPPEAGWQGLQQATARARQTADEMEREGAEVRFLRSIFVPESDACFFLYESSSADSVREAATRAELGVSRIDPVMHLDGKEQS